jgi:hypothetical protein
MAAQTGNSDSTVAITERTTLKRVAGRGSHDRATIHAILDEGLVCTVSFLIGGAPAAIPMAYCRIGETLYLHGSTANRMMRALRDGSEACVTVTLLDGLVLARSAFHHSVNFRCVVVYARAREVGDPAEKLAALEATVNHVVPGRWPDVRAPDADELRRTMILALPITEASAKLREGGPIDEPGDMAMQTWAGVIPLRQVAEPPVRCPAMEHETAAPAYARRYRRPAATATRDAGIPTPPNG